MSDPVRNEIGAMLAAFNAATGMDLGMSVYRKRCLLAIRGVKVVPQFGAADVTAVMEELKRRIGKMPLRYDHTSLEFNNAIAQTDRFEERALKLRILKAKKEEKDAAAKRPSAAPVRMTSEEEKVRLVADAKARAAALRRELFGGDR